MDQNSIRHCFRRLNKPERPSSQLGPEWQDPNYRKRFNIFQSGPYKRQAVNKSADTSNQPAPRVKPPSKPLQRNLNVADLSLDPYFFHGELLLGRELMWDEDYASIQLTPNLIIDFAREDFMAHIDHIIGDCYHVTLPCHAQICAIDTIVNFSKHGKLAVSSGRFLMHLGRWPEQKDELCFYQSVPITDFMNFFKPAKFADALDNLKAAIKDTTYKSKLPVLDIRGLHFKPFSRMLTLQTHNTLQELRENGCALGTNDGGIKIPPSDIELISRDAVKGNTYQLSYHCDARFFDKDSLIRANGAAFTVKAGHCLLKVDVMEPKGKTSYFPIVSQEILDVLFPTNVQEPKNEFGPQA